MAYSTSQPQNNKTPKNPPPQKQQRLLTEVLRSLEATGELVTEGCCSLHCERPYFIYSHGSRTVVKSAGGVEECVFDDMPTRVFYHCKTHFEHRDVMTAIRAFGHAEVAELLNLTGKPSYTRKLRTCPKGCSSCGQLDCKCATPMCYTDSSDNDESEDSCRENEVWGYYTLRTISKWQRFLPRAAKAQSNFLQDAFHSVSVFFSSALNSLKGLGERAIKAALRAVFGYAVDVLKEYFPSVNGPVMHFYALIVVTLCMYAMKIPGEVRGALITLYSYVVELSLPVEIGALVMNIFIGGSWRDTPHRRARAQSGDDLQSLVTKAVMGLAAYCMTQAVPDTKATSEFLVKCDRVPKAIRGIGNIVEYLTTVWDYIQKQMAKHFGWEYKIDSEIPIDVISNHEKIVFLGHADQRSQIPFDATIREQVKDAYLTYHRLRLLHQPSRTIQTFMDKYGGIIGTLMSKVSDSTAGQTENRQKPVVVFLKGGTGVGKSELLYFMGTDVLVDSKILTPEMTDDAIKRKINACMYPRYVENEYWDAYNEQPICLYDDFGQMTDSPTNPNLEFMELIRSANRFPYAVHMADISQKNNTFFRSQYIFATTNLDSIDPRSVVDPAAVRSRIDFGYNISVKKEFQVNPEGTREEDHKLDRTKLVASDGPTLAIYEICRWDPVTGNVCANETLSFPEMMAEIKLKRRAYAQHHEKSSETFVSYARRRMAVAQGWPQLHRFLRFSPEEIRTRPVRATFCFLLNEIALECREMITRAQTVMQQVWQKIRETVTKYVNGWALFGTLCGMLTYFFLRGSPKKGEDDYDDETAALLAKRPRYEILAWMDDAEKEYFREKRRLPPRISQALQDDRMPIPLWKAKGDEIDQFQQIWTNDEAIEELMDEGEAAYLAETGILPPSVLDKIPPNRHIRSESGRDLPRIIARIEGRKAKSQAFSSKQALEVVNVARANQIWLEYAPGVKALALAVGGRKVLLNRHYWKLFGDKFYYQSMTSKSRIEVKKEEVEIQEIPRSNYVDAILITLPRRVPMSRSLWSHFIRKKDLISLPGKYALLASRELDGSTTLKSGKIRKFATEKIDMDHESGFLSEKMTFFDSDIRTIDGDCGAFVVLDDDQFAGKICGFHFAGFYEGGALSVPLVYEDFEVLMSGSPTLVVPKEVLPEEGETFRHATFQGRVRRGVNNPTTTSFVKTDIFGLVSPSEMAPAVLAPLSRENGPGRKALMKVDQDVPYIEPLKLEKAKESFKEKLFSFPNKKPFVLTFEQAVAGEDSLRFAKGINRAHSAGYPWMLESTKGKRKWFGDDEWILDSPEALKVKAEVERKIELMKNNQYEPSLYVDTLKDETRDLERVALGKTRVFSAAPMDYIILMRMYFLSFFSFVMEHRNENEISVGTQAQSPDWDLMTKRILSNHGGIIAGDFSNFDGTLHSEILMTVLDIINEWYDDGAENQRIREFIFEDVVHSWHLTEKEVNSWNHSQPSGNPGTAIFNSMYNSLIMRLCYYDLEPMNMYELDTFNRNVVMVSYGDDNLLSVSPSANWYTQRTITDAMVPYGMTYTMETKSGEVCDYRTIEEVQYLQRFFRFEPKISMWVAPLKARSINERLNWNKKTPSPLETLTENAKGAIAEWALHPEDTYIMNMKKIQNVMVTTMGVYIPTRQQGYYLGFVRTGEYGAAFPAVSYT
ncbi:hypothetical protein 1 [Hubei picorna-like virus 22]|uniref:hypothetical protein 1 n=1 Tax=Hubei picorna-like virus 22 TaxID=1923102 RepID=UPI00090B7C4E|nr:hypothetical protein 1 [Hubei picorna-like virus 22]APG78437.1 hypothetical protein 1 [Hubei picorna-like virus 22]